MAKKPAAKANKGHVDIALDTPVNVSGVEKSSLRMREPRVTDQLAAKELDLGDERAEVALFANLCELTPDELGQLTMRDYRKLQLAYAGFHV